MSKKIAITMQKGGVGKTTSSINISAVLADKANKVLLFDMDGQSNLSEVFGYPKEKMGRADVTLADLIIEEIDDGECLLEDAIRKTDKENIYIVPAGKHVERAEKFLTIEKTNQLEILKRIFRKAERILDKFDFIIFDLSPSTSLINANALAVADYVLCPLKEDRFSLNGLNDLLSFISVVDRVNPSLELLGVFFTAYEPRKNSTQFATGQVQKKFGDKYIGINIPKDSSVADSPYFGKTLLEYDPKGRATNAYKELTDYILQKAK